MCVLHHTYTVILCYFVFGLNNLIHIPSGRFGMLYASRAILIDYTLNYSSRDTLMQLQISFTHLHNMHNIVFYIDILCQVYMHCYNYSTTIGGRYSFYD